MCVCVWCGTDYQLQGFSESLQHYTKANYCLDHSIYGAQAGLYIQLYLSTELPLISLKRLSTTQLIVHLANATSCGCCKGLEKPCIPLYPCPSLHTLCMGQKLAMSLTFELFLSQGLWLNHPLALCKNTICYSHMINLALRLTKLCTTVCLVLTDK